MTDGSLTLRELGCPKVDVEVEWLEKFSNIFNDSSLSLHEKLLALEDSAEKDLQNEVRNLAKN